MCIGQVKLFLNQRKGKSSSFETSLTIEKKSKLKQILTKIKYLILESFYVTISAQIMIFPIIILNFNTISLTFFISNILASFLIGPITIGGFLILLLSMINIKIAGVFSIVIEILLQLLILVAKFSSRIPFSKIYVITPSFLIILFYEISILLPVFLVKIKQTRKILYRKILYFKKNYILKNIKMYLVFLAIIIIISYLFSCFQSELTIHFIDVGQGDSTLIITPRNKKILIDTGGSTGNTAFDVGEDVLVPYLLDRGIKTLDCVLISHFDADHCNGLIAVLEKLKVKKVIIVKQQKSSTEYETILEITIQKKIPMVEVKSGDKILFDNNIYLQILHPQKELIQENRT